MYELESNPFERVRPLMLQLAKVVDQIQSVI